MTLLPWSRPLTYADLEPLPDDGHRYELVDGTLVVTPAPIRAHQRAVGKLHVLLTSGCPDDLEVFLAPFDVKLADDTVMQPDLLVTRRTDTNEKNLAMAPLLAIEVLSPSTRLIDLNLKRARYEQAACPSYWVVDPDQRTVIVWELHEGRYAEVARVSDEQTTTVGQPFEVVLQPSALIG